MKPQLYIISSTHIWSYQLLTGYRNNEITLNVFNPSIKAVFKPCALNQNATNVLRSKMHHKNHKHTFPHRLYRLFKWFAKGNAILITHLFVDIGRYLQIHMYCCFIVNLYFLSFGLCAILFQTREQRFRNGTIWLNVAVTVEERPPFTHPEVNRRWSHGGERWNNNGCPLSRRLIEVLLEEEDEWASDDGRLGSDLSLSLSLYDCNQMRFENLYF